MRRRACRALPSSRTARRSRRACARTPASAADAHLASPGVGAPPAAWRRRRRTKAVRRRRRAPEAVWRRRRTTVAVGRRRPITWPPSHGTAIAPLVPEPARTTSLRRLLHMRRSGHGRRLGRHRHCGATQRHRRTGGNQQGTETCHSLTSRCITSRKALLPCRISCESGA